MNDESGSRSWLTADEWVYPLGDRKAVGGFELGKHARLVYDYIMKSREQQLSNPTNEANQAFRVAMDEFNQNINQWTDYWLPSFSEGESISITLLEINSELILVPGNEPWHVAHVRFFRDYMRLYFNSVLLHRILVTNDNNPLAGDAPATIRFCYTSALGVLRESANFGKMEVLYYLWDTSHLMTAYAAMLLLKLLKQARHVPGVSIEEALEVLVETTAAHTAAAESLSSSESLPGPSVPKAPAATAVDAQARLFSAIVFRVRLELRNPTPGAENSSISEDATLQEAKDSISVPPDDSFAWSESFATFAQTTNLQHDDPHNLSVGQLADEMDFSLEMGFVDARFMDAGLLFWDQPGIFIDPR